MMTNWWSLSTSRLEDPRYQALTAAERLYLEYTISSFSQHGSYFESDQEVAVTVGLSEDKIRRARRKVGRPSQDALRNPSRFKGQQLCAGFGWVIYTPGFISGHRHLATRYLNVPILKVPKGQYFACVHRFTFLTLLAEIRMRRLTHTDVVVWLALAYKYWRCRGKRENHSFFITKRELVALSGIANAPARVDHLHKSFQFSSGHHLFEYSDEGQRLVFTQWALCADPSKNESSAGILESWRREVAVRVHDKRLVADMKEKNRIARRSPKSLMEEHPSVFDTPPRTSGWNSRRVG
jgi:hypothetical protein